MSKCAERWVVRTQAVRRFFWGGVPVQTRKQRLGDALVQAGLITPAQLTAALEQQSASGARLGQVLVQQGFVTDVDVARTVAEQLGQPYLSGEDVGVERQVARLLPEPVARRLLALPIRREGQALLVAMVDPYNVFALDEVRSLTGHEVRAAVMTERNLSALIRSAFQLGGMEAAGEAASVPAPAEHRGLQEQADDAPAVKLVNAILQQAIEERASDIHWEPQEATLRVRFRVDGMLREVASVPKSLQTAVTSRLKVLAELDISEHRLPQDGRFQITHQGREVDLRVSTLPTVHGEKVELRLLDRSQTPLGLDQIGLRPAALQAYRTLFRRPYGLVLMTGPTGSGKTTTLVATLAELNLPDRNIVTIEDPVEYHIPGVNQVQLNPKAGLDFAGGLRSILRQDPNIIMVGEIRDAETADIAVRAALTGHLVLSTLHTNNAAGALARLADMGVERFLLASSVAGVVAQRLVRRLCSRCREPYTLPAGVPERIGLPLPGGPVTLHRAKGCPNCTGTGYAGRLPIFEMITITETLRQLITGGAPASALAAAARTEGMPNLLADGIAKALEGETTLEEVRRVALADL